MSVEFFTSDTADGSMKSPDQDFETVIATRTTFLQKHKIQPQDTTLVHLSYESDDFCRYHNLTDSDKGDGVTRSSAIIADALVVTEPGHALFLPLADCVGTVIHDSVTNILMLSHLGRHNLEQFGGTKCIEYLIKNHNVEPANLHVWLSPAAGSENYPLYSFNNHSLHDVSSEQLIAAGVLHENIVRSPINSAADQRYYSHSQFLKGNRDTDGRFAVVAVLN